MVLSKKGGSGKACRKRYAENCQVGKRYVGIGMSIIGRPEKGMPTREGQKSGTRKDYAETV